MKLLDHYSIPLEGKNAVVVGRSNLVGKPLAQLLLDRNATVTVCHSRTRDLGSITSRADIVCVAIGKAKFLKADMVKEGAVVIDVGMDRDENGKLCGDVDFAEVAPKCSYITPRPRRSRTDDSHHAPAKHSHGIQTLPRHRVKTPPHRSGIRTVTDKAKPRHMPRLFYLSNGG